MRRMVRKILLVLALALIVSLLVFLQPTYAVKDMICIDTPLMATDGKTNVGIGRYRVVEEEDHRNLFERMFEAAGGHYGIVQIDSRGFESGGVFHAPAAPLESNSTKRYEASDDCP